LGFRFANHQKIFESIPSLLIFLAQGPYNMKKLLLLLVFLPGISLAQDHQANIRKIYDAALTSGHTYENLRYLCKEVGNRLAGSPGAAAAVEWTRQLMESYGFDTVYLQPVMVPHWDRGGTDIVKITNSVKHGSLSLNAL